MRDTSLLDDIRRDRKHRKNKLIRRILIGIPLALIAVISVSALASSSQPASIDRPILSTSKTEPEPPISESVQETAPKPTVSSPASSESAPNGGNSDYAAINALLCRDSMDSVKAINQRILATYSDNKKFWIDTFRGAYGSQEAAESKQFYIDYTKGEFSDLISRSGPTLQKTCNSSTTINEVLLQPDYNAWQ